MHRLVSAAMFFVLPQHLVRADEARHRREPASDGAVGRQRREPIAPAPAVTRCYCAEMPVYAALSDKNTALQLSLTSALGRRRARSARRRAADSARCAGSTSPNRASVTSYSREQPLLGRARGRAQQLVPDDAGHAQALGADGRSRFRSSHTTSSAGRSATPPSSDLAVLQPPVELEDVAADAHVAPATRPSAPDRELRLRLTDAQLAEQDPRQRLPADSAPGSA